MQDVNNEVFKKVIELINKSNKITCEKDFRMGYNYYFDNGLVVERYNGGFRIVFDGENLFSTHSVNSSPTSELLEKIIFDKEKESKQKATQNLMKL